MKFLEKNRNVLIFFFLIIILIYGRTLWGDFVFDDRYVTDQAQVFKNSDIKQIFMLPYWSVESGLYRPITLFTYALNFIFIGDGPFGFHLVNLILYGLTCFFIFKFVERFFGSRPLGLLTAFTFLILPIHSEVVANIIGRAEILALLFSILFLNELVREKINYWMLGLFLFLAISSKETAVAVLPISLFVVYFREVSRFNLDTLAFFRRYFYVLLTIISSTVLYFSLRLAVLGQDHFLGVETSIIENPLLFTSFLNRFSTALSILSMYIGKILVPVNLCSDYSFNQIPIVGFWNFQTLAGLFILISFIFGIFYFFRKQPVISLGFAIFIFSFLPVSNLFFPIGTIAGERLMFYPSLGIALILAYLIFKIYEYAKTNKYAGGALLFVCVFLITFYVFVGIWRSGDWLSEKRLFISARKCAPNSVLSRSNMGTVYYFENKLKEAEQEFLKANEINDTYSKGLNNLGLVYWKMGDNKRAKEFYLKAAQNEFPYPGAYENLALLYLSQGNISDAKRWLLVFFSGNEKMVDAYVRNYRK